MNDIIRQNAENVKNPLTQTFFRVIIYLRNGKSRKGRKDKQEKTPTHFQEVMKMTKTTVSLQAINDVKDFVNIVMKYEFDIDLVSGRYAVDAKSIMGIFSLDLSKPIELNAHTDDAEKFMAESDKYIVK